MMLRRVDLPAAGRPEQHEDFPPFEGEVDAAQGLNHHIAGLIRLGDVLDEEKRLGHGSPYSM
jgi:hypothetical protein